MWSQVRSKRAGSGRGRPFFETVILEKKKKKKKEILSLLTHNENVVE